MIEVMPDVQGNQVGVIASGQVTAEDYEKVLIPEVEARLQAHPKVRLLYHIGPDFTGFSAGAMLDDAKLGLRHFKDWDRIAVVTDVSWIRAGIDLFRFTMPCPVKVFGNSALDEAKGWIASESVR
jgi:hypothetical protein